MTTKAQAVAQMGVVTTSDADTSAEIATLAKIIAALPDPTPPVNTWYLARDRMIFCASLAALASQIATLKQAPDVPVSVELVLADASTPYSSIAQFLSNYGDRGNLPSGVTIRPQTQWGATITATAVLPGAIDIYNGGDRDLCVTGFTFDSFGKAKEGSGCTTVAGDVANVWLNNRVTNYGNSDQHHGFYLGTSQIAGGALGTFETAPRNLRIGVDANMPAGSGCGFHAYHASGYGAHDIDVTIKVRGAGTDGMLIAPNFDRSMTANWKMAVDIDGTFVNSACRFYGGDGGTTRVPPDGIDPTCVITGTMINRNTNAKGPTPWYQPNVISGLPAVPTINGIAPPALRSVQYIIDSMCLANSVQPTNCNGKSDTNPYGGDKVYGQPYNVMGSLLTRSLDAYHEGTPLRDWGLIGFLGGGPTGPIDRLWVNIRNLVSVVRTKGGTFVSRVHEDAVSTSVYTASQDRSEVAKSFQALPDGNGGRMLMSEFLVRAGQAWGWHFWSIKAMPLPADPDYLFTRYEYCITGDPEQMANANAFRYVGCDLPTSETSHSRFVGVPLVANGEWQIAEHCNPNVIVPVPDGRVPVPADFDNLRKNPPPGYV